MHAVRLRGTRVAYAVIDCGGASFAGETVRLMDVRHRRLAAWSESYNAAGREDVLSYGVTDLEFGPGLSLAWIADEGGTPMPVAEVRALSYAAPACAGVQLATPCKAVPVELDAGADIAPDSLAASGEWVYWMRAGAPRVWAP